MSILLAAAFCHFLNDMVQSLIPAIYPILKKTFHLDFSQIGMITLTYQITASLLQPLVGHFNDRHPAALLAGGRHGLHARRLGDAFACVHLSMLLGGAALVGIGSAVFHPESSRVARMVSGGQHGFAQSLFQVGGNAGSSLGPLLAAFIVLPHGQGSLAWFSAVALLGIVVLARCRPLVENQPAAASKEPRSRTRNIIRCLSPRKVYSLAGGA